MANKKTAQKKEVKVVARARVELQSPALALTTFSNATDAEAFAHTVMDLGWAACCNIVPSMTSIYRWEGKIHRESEVLVLIKLTMPQFKKLKSGINEIHPYDVPELIMLPILDGNPEYMQWMQPLQVSN